MLKWKKNTDQLYVLSDIYADRFVETLRHRCTACKFFIGTATYSHKVVFWHKDYATPEDAMHAAKNWLCRGELETDVELKTFNYAPFTIVPPEPEIEQRGW